MFPRGFDYANKLHKALNERELRNRKRREKVQRLLNDSAATDGEKAAAKAALERLNL